MTSVFETEDLPELFDEAEANIGLVSLEAIARLQKKGIDIFYFDFASAQHILEKPSGERFVIRYTNETFEVLKKLDNEWTNHHA